MTNSTTTQDVIQELQSIIESNVSDPNTRRSGDDGRWVFDHFPKYDGKNLPRIGIYTGGESYELQSIGSVKSSLDSDILVTTIVRRKNSWDVDSDGVNEPAEQVVDYLTTRILEEVEGNQSQLQSLDCLRYVLPDNVDMVRQSDANWIAETLQLNAKIYR